MGSKHATPRPPLERLAERIQMTRESPDDRESGSGMTRLPITTTPDYVLTTVALAGDRTQICGVPIRALATQAEVQREAYYARNRNEQFMVCLE